MVLPLPVEADLFDWVDSRVAVPCADRDRARPSQRLYAGDPTSHIFDSEYVFQPQMGVADPLVAAAQFLPADSCVQRTSRHTTVTCRRCETGHGVHLHATEVANELVKRAKKPAAEAAVP